MKIAMGVVTTVVMLFAGVALAQGAGAPGYGPGRAAGPSASSVRSFQKETLALRDQLMAKQADLQDEYAKAQPDQVRITSLASEIASLRGKIHAAADKYGLGPRGRGYGAGMYGWGGRGMGGAGGPRYGMARAAGYMRYGHGGCGNCWQ